jgi:hypothetical protein
LRPPGFLRSGFDLKTFTVHFGERFVVRDFGYKVFASDPFSSLFDVFSGGEIGGLEYR